MKRLIIFLLLFAAIKVAGQTTGYLRFDTVLIYKQGGTAELILRSSTKDTLGVLVNYSNGRTRFMKSRAINDSTIVVGLDTLVIRGATGGTSGQITTQVQKPIMVLQGDSTLGIPDTLALDYGYGLTIDVDSTLVIDSSKYSTVKGTLDTAINVLTRGIVVVDTIQLIHSGVSVATYQNNKLIGSKLLYVSIESYPVGFLTRSNSVYMTFNPSTGTITFTNGRLYDDDMIYILYRTGAIFVTDGSGNLLVDDDGNYIIEN